MKKEAYITPQVEMTMIHFVSGLCLDSNNETGTGTGQEGSGENGGYTPGTGGDEDPEEGDRNSKHYNVWDAWD